MPTPQEILKQYWGYPAFRPLQEDIIESVLNGNDTLALLPTGGGKSICFQVPAMIMDGLCLVITPLIALMKDQVYQLQKRNISALAIYSGMSYREIDIALDNCINSQIKFLYVSPERLKTEVFLERVKKMNVSLLAVDEAHCISQWGYDFRPPYLEIADFRTFIPGINVIALTATATTQVREDIQEKLAFGKDSRFFVKSFARDNLSYSVRFEDQKEKKLLQILENVAGSAVLYVRSRKKTKELAAFLQRERVSADFYHAGLSNEVRSQKQDRWINNQTRVMVSTNAFGMGIDKPDVRVVIHWDLPDNLEAYYQEAGRAGRDEKKAFAVVLINNNDVADLKSRVEQSFPSLDFMKKVYQSLANYLKIAVGSNLMVSYDFDIQDFTNSFQLPPFETYQALKKLESEGFLQLNESFSNPSKFYFNVDKRKLYEFQVSNAEMDYFIKALLRIYGGELFTNFQFIYESQIAKMTRINEKQVCNKLNFLHESDIGTYIPKKENPQITFLTARYDANKLPLDVKGLNQRRQIHLDKMKSVIKYVENDMRCRTQLLLDYFDEVSYTKCGICDNCLKQKQNQTMDISKIREEIIALLIEKSLHPDELVQHFKNVPENQIIIIIRELLDMGEISYNAIGYLEKV